MPDVARKSLAQLIFAETGDPDEAAHVADAILAEFLVVPRSDIQGTQYAWRNFDEHGGEWVWPCHSQEVAVADASSARRRDRAYGREPKAEALERPIAPWTPIPLPENGEQQ